jgi:signal transduction histidine kinase
MQVELRSRMEAQRSAENRLIQAAKLAAVGEMAAAIAHELNNPLTSVAGFSELAMEGLSNTTETYKDLELVLKEARRARDVVRRLLDFARQSESTRSNASLNEVIEDVVALSRHLIHTSGVDLKLNLEPDLPWVSMDSNQMKQVLLNLVHNALQAMPTGGELEIKSESAMRNQRTGVMVSVCDSGVGIPPAEQARVFEPFYTTKGNQGGTGLGLSVTYGIVTDHGGQIDVESQPWVGSKFMVWLPL